MWDSFKIFFSQFSYILWAAIIFVFFDSFDVYDKWLKPLLPVGWGDIAMPHIGFYLIIIAIFWAAFKAYHDLRMKKMKEFLDFAPEYKEHQVFRIFYKLYREGEFLENSATIRRQEWDDKVLEEMQKYCTENCKANYLMDTWRQSAGGIKPLMDEKYKEAVEYIKDMLDNNFTRYLK